MSSQRWGRYCRVYAVNHTRTGERTNLGVIIFDEQGNQIAFRADNVDRAVARGDLPQAADDREYWNQYVTTFTCGYRTCAEVEKAHGSIGHAMSCIQVSQLMAVDIERVDIDSIFERDVLGKK